MSDQRPLHTLQLSMVPRRGIPLAQCLECVMGGALGAAGMLLLLAWLF